MSRSRPALTLTLIATLATAPLFGSWEEGVAAYQEGRYEAAAAVFSELVERNPKAPEGHFMLGRSLYRLKRVSEASVALQKAVDLGPADASYSLLLAQVQLKMGQAGQALETLSKLEPGAVPSTMRGGFNGVLAKVAAATGRNGQAYATLEKAVAVDPQSKPLWIALGKVANRLGEPEKRFAALCRAFEIDPEDSEVGVLAVRVAIALAQGASEAEPRREWYRQAATAGRALLTAFPTADNLKMVAGAEMGAQQYEGAIETFERALASGGDDPRLRFDLARSCIPVGRYDDAIRHLQQALDRSPEADLVPGIHAARGLAYRHLEDFDSAAEAYRLAGDDQQSAEMAKYAENRREWAAAKADCVKKQAQIADLRKDSDGLRDTADWQELDREFNAVLAACAPYLQDES